MVLEDVKKEFIYTLYTLGRTNGTVNNHKHTLRRFLESLAEQDITELEDVKPRHLKRLIRDWQVGGKQKNISINGHLARLKVFFRYCIDEEYIDVTANPMERIKNLKEERTIIHTFTDEEVRLMIACCDGKSYTAVRDRLILMILFDTGVRVSELTGILNEDVYETNIRIRGKGSRQRSVYISPKVKRQMMKYERLRRERFKHRRQEPYYFLSQTAERIDRSTINKILKNYAEEAKVRDEVRVSPHTCRHYYAQAHLRRGLDVYSVSRLLGHSDTDVTSQYLRGLKDEDILIRSIATSPLMNM